MFARPSPTADLSDWAGRRPCRARGAALNVHVNLGSIDEQGCVEGLRSEVEKLEAAATLWPPTPAPRWPEARG